MDETNNVLEDIISATGLPEDAVRRELYSYVLDSGKTPQNLNMEEIKEVLVNLLQDVFLQLKNKNFSEKAKEDGLRSLGNLKENFE